MDGKSHVSDSRLFAFIRGLFEDALMNFSMPEVHRDIYSVSRLNREARELLEGGLPLLWVEGEISNLARPASRHLYFTLKDDAAQVRCAMFRNHNLYLRFAPRDGMRVLARARVSLYEARGEFQLLVEHMEEAGFGALQRAFEALKQKLAIEGLFDNARKRPLPVFPECLGIVTSPSGAALRDILSVLRRRYPGLPVVIYPTLVQGEAASAAIVEALALAALRRECDVLILARGGGSLEDLWAFNDEQLARAVAACPIPVVSGVGHEIDFTLADLAADARAATPSAAAELVSPDRIELMDRLLKHRQKLDRLMGDGMQRWRRDFSWLQGRLRQCHPGKRLQQQNQRLDELEQRLGLAMRYDLQLRTGRINGFVGRLRRHSPQPRLIKAFARNQHLRQRLDTAIGHCLDARHQGLTRLARTLDAVSPLATLRRGYAIATRAKEPAPLLSNRQVHRGEDIQVRLAEGRLSATVTSSDAEEIQDY